MARPSSDKRVLLATHLNEKRATMRELSQAHQLSLVDVDNVLRRLKLAGTVRVAAHVRVDYSRRPVAVYEATPRPADLFDGLSRGLFGTPRLSLRNR